MERLKCEANDYFRRKDPKTALTLYEKALTATPEEEGASSSAAELEVAILSNMAACYLQLGQSQKCLETCDKILSHTEANQSSLTLKAYFRRAKAYAALEQHNKALADVGKILEVDRQNQAARKLGSEIMEQINKSENASAEKRATRVMELLDQLESEQDEAATTSLSTLYSLLSDNLFAEEFVKADGLKYIVRNVKKLKSTTFGAIWYRLITDSTTTARQYCIDFFLSEKLHHIILEQLDGTMSESFARVLSIFSEEFIRKKVTALPREQLTTIIQKTAQAIRILLTISQPIQSEVVVLRACASLSASKESYDALLEKSILRWCYNAFSTSGDNDLESQKVEERRSCCTMVFAGIFQQLWNPSTPGGSGQEIRGIILGLLQRCLDHMGGNLCQLAKNEERKAIEELRKSKSKSEDSDQQEYEEASPEGKPEVVEAERVAQLLHVLTMVRKETAASFLQRRSSMCVIEALLACPSTTAQSAACEFLADLAADEEGKSVLNKNLVNLLATLSSQESLSVSSAASVALARITTVEYGQGPGVSALSHVRQSGENGDPRSEFEKAKSEKQSQGKEALVAVYHSLADLLQNATEEWRSSKSRVGTKASLGRCIGRAVEGLSSIISRTPVKNELIQDLETLGTFFDLAEMTLLSQNDSSNEDTTTLNSIGGLPTLLGFAFTFYALTISVHRQRREHLQNMDVDPEQWEELKRLTMSSGKDEDTEDDPPERVNTRIREVTKRGCVRIVGRIYDSLEALQYSDQPTKNHLCKELLSMCLCNLVEPFPSELETQRGECIQQGCVPMLVRLVKDEGNSSKGVFSACQGLAKLCITTNPSLFSSTQQEDLLYCLLQLTESNDQLQQFEACTALTNLASLGPDLQSKLTNAKGLTRLEDCQFEDHTMVRRAATECITNLATQEEARKLIAQKRPILWVALLKSFVDDVQTCRAASGAVAMATMGVDNDEATLSGINYTPHQAVRDLLEQNVVGGLVHSLLSGDEQIQHRALTALNNVAQLKKGKEAIATPANIDTAAFETADEEKEEEIANQEYEVSAIALCTLASEGKPLPHYFAGEATSTETLPDYLRELAQSVVDLVLNQRRAGAQS
eukprot:gb/GECG01011783.1/.p1 GENE.gb/GECG01011783.1/~~gb/GECG01011783.1/.p1  ORF type:complete len:1099 (+),score=162.25 gb/GECG01011783.1/:1-3297(+)